LASTVEANFGNLRGRKTEVDRQIKEDKGDDPVKKKKVNKCVWEGPGLASSCKEHQTDEALYLWGEKGRKAGSQSWSLGGRTKTSLTCKAGIAEGESNRHRNIRESLYAHKSGGKKSHRIGEKIAFVIDPGGVKQKCVLFERGWAQRGRTARPDLRG